MWLVEVRAGVYVGHYSARTRGRLWDEIERNLDDGNAVMVWREANESGFDFKTLGRNRRMPVDFDGLRLVRFMSSEGDRDDEEDAFVRFGIDRAAGDEGE